MTETYWPWMASGWQESASGRTNFVEEVQGEREQSTGGSAASADPDELEFRSHEGRIEYRHENAYWAHVEYITDLPISDAVLHSSGDHSLSESDALVILKWTECIVSNRTKFTGANTCANVLTEGTGAVVSANRPVPLHTDALSFRGIQRAVCAVGNRYAYLYTPDSAGDTVSGGVVYVACTPGDTVRYPGSVLLRLLRSPGYSVLFNNTVKCLTSGEDGPATGTRVLRGADFAYYCDSGRLLRCAAPMVYGTWGRDCEASCVHVKGGFVIVVGCTGCSSEACDTTRLVNAGITTSGMYLHSRAQVRSSSGGVYRDVSRLLGAGLHVSWPDLKPGLAGEPRVCGTIHIQMGSQPFRLKQSYLRIAWSMDSFGCMQGIFKTTSHFEKDLLKAQRHPMCSGRRQAVSFLHINKTLASMLKSILLDAETVATAQNQANTVSRRPTWRRVEMHMTLGDPG